MKELESIREESLVKKITVSKETINDLPRVGQWYWITTKSWKGTEETWLGCVIDVGSNYIHVEGVRDEHNSHYSTRIHLDNFYEKCKFEPNAEQIVRDEIEIRRTEIERLMHEVKQITAGLSIGRRQRLSEGGETRALAIRTGSQPVEQYKEALVKAKEEQLPVLFERIEKLSGQMAGWMKAPLIPLRGEQKQLEEVTKLIENRIFNVEIYAGLIEQVVQIREGERASLGTPIHIFQRRAYMDEECLARYEAGGMEFKDLDAFDAWVARDDNMYRLLPFPRCILAFRVRRHTKERECISLGQYFKIQSLEEADKSTFLYMRNGDQLFRLETNIQFGHQLFPDFDKTIFNGTVYAKMFGSRVDKIISEGHYLELKKEYQKRRDEKAGQIRELRRQGVPKDKWSLTDRGVFGIRDESREFEKHDSNNVYFDDINKYIQEKIDEHNRLILVLQGLLDRSPVFHPHPPYQLWSPEGFNIALRLIYDDSRSLTDGDKPNFESYRKKLNLSLTMNSITVGQQLAWMKREAEKENRRRLNDWRLRDEYRELKIYAPYGNPGPGEIAKVKKVSKRGCTFTWKRERKIYKYGEEDYLSSNVIIPTNELLNISAYTPGDFKIFFDDPRTRAEYLQWAPLLLEAEEFWAGNRQISGD